MIRQIALCLALFGTTATNALSQICANGYDRDDRPIVLNQYQPVSAHLTRMAELALISANEDYSPTQRMALNNEFSAHRQFIEDYGDRYRPRLSQRSNAFIADVIDPDFLSLSDKTLLGATYEEALDHIRLALDAVNQASSQIQFCLAASWERIQIVNSNDPRQCVGGYDRTDRRIVERDIERAQKILEELAYYASTIANGVFSEIQRNTIDAEFEFARENLEILGQRNRPAASRRTNYFLRNLIDPAHLGVLSAILTGPTIAEAQANASAALAAVRNAQQNLRRCS